MLIQVCCGDVCFEWFDWKTVEINTDDYGYFSLDYRMGSWHLIGYYKRNEENKKDSDQCGIYSITNKLNGKRYIGQTYNFKYRWMRHRS